MTAAGWDAAMTHELRAVYYAAYRTALRDTASGAVAHDAGLHAVAEHAARIERETAPSF